jgi:hypothetical protein
MRKDMKHETLVEILKGRYHLKYNFKNYLKNNIG